MKFILFLLISVTISNYFRDKLEEKAALEAEIASLDEQILEMRNEHKLKQQEITNQKISQSMRQSQIARLSGLSQPIELDQTYFFVDRHAGKNGSPSSVSVVEENLAPVNGGIGKIGHMRTGEAVLLEARLLDISRLLDGHLNAFSGKVSAVNTSGSSLIMMEGELSNSRTKLKSEANALVEELDKTEHSLFATMFEVLNLRLRMIVAQRKEVEMREALTADRHAFRVEEASILADMEKQLMRTKAHFERDLNARTHTYEKQLKLSTKKLENLDSLNPQEAVEKKERVLREKLQIVQNRCLEAFQSIDISFCMQFIIALCVLSFRYEQLKKRHALEVEGYGNEAKALRKKLQHILTILKQQSRTASHE